MPTATAHPTPPAATLPPGIEIFRAGTHIDDAGNSHTFSEADVAATARAYNPAVHEAPLCVGHPQHDLPAYGWVTQAHALGGVLSMDSRAVEPQFAEMVRAERFKKRSTAFWPPSHPNNPTPGVWAIRHVAFLGAQPPAVKGLADLPEFAAGDAEGCIYFSEGGDAQQPTAGGNTMPGENKPDDKAELETRLKAAQDEAATARAAASDANAKLAKFAEDQTRERHAAHVSFCEDQVKAGRLKPADKGDVVAVLDHLAVSAPVEFSEGETTKKVSPADVVKRLVAGAAPVVQFGEHAPGRGDVGLADKGMSDAEIDKLAKKHAAEKHVSYAEALAAITSFTE